MLPAAASAPGSRPGRFARDPAEYAKGGPAQLTLIRGGVSDAAHPELETTP